MKKKELEFFKQLLIKEKLKIIKEIKNLTEDTLNKTQRDTSGDLSGYAFHMADVASDNYDREFNLNLASSEQEILYSIDEALQKIDNKEYGKCENCNGPISKKRLKALPYAKLCLRCKNKEEKS
jgi:RNA polymerase-binding protein DksA